MPNKPYNIALLIYELLPLNELACPRFGSIWMGIAPLEFGSESETVASALETASIDTTL